MIKKIKKYWFMILLIAIFSINLADTSGIAAGIGIFMKSNLGPDTAIFLMFVCSGLMLDMEQIRAGVRDFRGIIIALIIIFAAAPFTAYFFGKLHIPDGIIIGIFLVSAMPTTLSSGVVMTGAAGGNIAHALLITVIASCLAVFTVPFTLSLLIDVNGNAFSVNINKTAMMIKIVRIVLVPLFTGLFIKHFTGERAHMFFNRSIRALNNINLCFVASVVWMGISTAREVILKNSISMLGIVFLVVVIFHVLLIFISFAAARIFRLKKGRRESVIFMGIQKTLALSIVLQISVFPEYGLALVVCVLHHIVHLIIDSYIAGKFAEAANI